MTWLDKIKEDLTITCGDGNEYTPKYLNATKSKEYNLTAFSFIDVPGQLVDRKQPSARQYFLQLFFDGNENLENSQSFENSADDPRAWTLSHPYYGDLIVQPTSLSFNNSNHNVTEVTAEVIETITEDFPSADVSVEDQINADAQQANENLAEQFDEADAQSIELLSENNTSAYANAVNDAPEANQTAYFNTFRDANTAINNATTDPLNAMRKAQNVLTAPVRFGNQVRGRVNLLKNQFYRLKNTVKSTLTLPQKLALQASMGATITAMSQSAIGDYNSRSEALLVIDQIQDASHAYINALDEMRGNGYLPSAEPVNLAISTAALAAANVLTILNDTRQEREIITEADSNLIVLAHRVNMGDDLEGFINLNEIGINEHLQIKQGRKIKYYV